MADLSEKKSKSDKNSTNQISEQDENETGDPIVVDVALLRQGKDESSF